MAGVLSSGLVNGGAVIFSSVFSSHRAASEIKASVTLELGISILFKTILVDFH